MDPLPTQLGHSSFPPCRPEVDIEQTTSVRTNSAVSGMTVREVDDKATVPFPRLDVDELTRTRR